MESVNGRYCVTVARASPPRVVAATVFLRQILRQILRQVLWHILRYWHRPVRYVTIEFERDNPLRKTKHKRSAMAAARPHVELLEKNKPQQARAKRTYEAILTSAAQLLVEVGIERISTNQVAERAGITVPALYRYFPNKYAVLHALGSVLMDKQNAVFEQWFDHYLALGDPQLMLDNIYELLRQTHDVTRERVGGLELVHALRAVAPLREVRLESHRRVASQFATMVGAFFDRPVDELLRAQTRLTIDTGYAIVEMALEDDSLQTETMLREGARIMQLYWQDFVRAG
jgi:AcrR family transcriptional regulator